MLAQKSTGFETLHRWCKDRASYDPPPDPRDADMSRARTRRSRRDLAVAGGSVGVLEWWIGHRQIVAAPCEISS